MALYLPRPFRLGFYYDDGSVLFEPVHDGCFDGMTRHVYRLSWLFHNEDHWREFLRYLIRRYRVHTVILAGCELLQRMLPDLQREFPEIAVVDRAFSQQTR